MLVCWAEADRGDRWLKKVYQSFGMKLCEWFFVNKFKEHIWDAVHKKQFSFPLWGCYFWDVYEGESSPQNKVNCSKKKVKGHQPP